MKKICSFLIILFLLIACKDSSGRDSLVNISGTFSQSVLSGTGVERVTSTEDYLIYYYHNSGTIYDISEIQKQASINLEGQFSLEIPEGDMFIAFLVDTSLEYQKVVGVIGIGTENTSVWESIDTELMEGDILLGNIESDQQVGDLLISENTLDDFINQIKDLEQVRLQALMDDSIRYLKNQINISGSNLERTNASYILNISDSSLITNSWAMPENWDFSGYQLTVWFKDYTENDNVLLYPPSEVYYGDGSVFNNSNPLDGEQYSENFGFGIGELPESLLQQAPIGYWVLKQNGITIAELDFGTAQPLIDDKFAFPIVVPRVNTENGSDLITSIDFRWYKLDEVGNYIEISADMIENYIGSEIGLELSDFNQSGRREYYNISVTESFFPPDEWHMNASGNNTENWAEYIGIGCDFGPFSIRATVR